MICYDNKDITNNIMDFCLIGLAGYVEHLKSGCNMPYVCGYSSGFLRDETSEIAKRLTRNLVDPHTNGNVMPVIYVCRSMVEFWARRENFADEPNVNVVVADMFEDENLFEGVDLDFKVIIMDNAGISVKPVLAAIRKRGYDAPPMVLALGDNN